MSNQVVQDEILDAIEALKERYGHAAVAEAIDTYINNR